MVDLGRLGRNAAGLVLVALRSFLGTMLLMIGVGLVLAVSTYYLLAQHQVWYGLVGAVVALIEALIVGVIWAGKRAVVMALVHGLQRHRAGSAAVRILFERLFGVSGDRKRGERGSKVVQAVERLPLAQAEKRLNDAVRGLLNAPVAGTGVGGRVRRWLEGKLLGHVQAYTLARFRESGAEQGGVDLVRVQTELESRVDDWLIGKLKKGLNVWKVLVLVGLPAQVFATLYLALALLNSHGALFK